MLRPINVGGRLRSSSPQARLELEHEISTEIAFHLSMRVEANIEAGMSPEAAVRAARAQFGDVDEVIAGCVDAADNHPLLIIRRRIRTVLTAGLGIGLATSLFLLAYSVLVRPPATYHGDGSWIGVWWEQKDTGSRSADSSLKEYLAWEKNNSVFSEMALASYRSVVYDDGNQPVRALAKYVTPGYLKQHGVKPHLGRRFHSVEPVINGLPGILLGYTFWKSRYGGDTGIVGRRTRVDGAEYVVVGVAPENFRMYNRTDFWVPYDLDAEAERWADLPIHLASGKLKPDVTMRDVRDDLGLITPSRITKSDGPGVWQVLPRTAQEIYGQGASGKARLFAMVAMIVAAIVVLRLVRDTPSSVDILLGGLVAVGIAVVFLSVTADLALGSIARRFNLDLGFNSYILLPAGTLIVGILLSRLPRPPKSFVGILQTGAGLALTTAALIATHSSVHNAPKPDPVDINSIILDVLMPRQQFQERGEMGQYLRRLADSAADYKSVELAGLTRALRNGYSIPLDVQRSDAASSTGAVEAAVHVVDSSFFAGRHLNLSAGHLFSRTPAPTEHRTAVVSETLAGMLWRDDDPIGSRFRLGRSPAEFYVTGVVSGALPAVYASIWQIPGRDARILLRTNAGADREAVVSHLIRRIRNIDQRVAVAQANRTAEAEVAEGSDQGLAIVLWILAFVILTLVWQHIGETVRQTVSSRLNEIGLRKLVGASGHHILALIVKPIAVVLAVGILVGSPLAYGVNMLAGDALVCDGADYLWIHAGGIALIMVVATLACAVPAARATRLEPSTVFGPRDRVLSGVWAWHSTAEHSREDSRGLESKS